jgi:hypothetical protein
MAKDVLQIGEAVSCHMKSLGIVNKYLDFFDEQKDYHIHISQMREELGIEQMQGINTL